MGQRKSAKQIIESYVRDLLARPYSPVNENKLEALETVASRMGWMDLFNRIRYRSGNSEAQQEKWFQK